MKEYILRPGSVVWSKAGRDKNRCFIVISTDGTYALIADGKTRKLQSPKKKKHRHLRTDGTELTQAAELIESGTLSDKVLREQLKPYGSQQQATAAAGRTDNGGKQCPETT